MRVGVEMDGWMVLMACKGGILASLAFSPKELWFSFLFFCLHPFHFPFAMDPTAPDIDTVKS